MNKYLVRPWHLYRRGGYFQKYLASCQASQVSPKLHVGCGDRPIAGWCNIDVAHLNSEVQYVDALKRFPFEDASFQYIFSEHFIEHLSFKDGVRFFKEAYRVLKPGGTIRTATPDLDFIRELNDKTDAEKRYVEWTAGSFMPGQPKSPVASINLLFYGWGHRYIYNAHFLQQVLSQLGFKDFHVYKPGQSAIPDLKGIEQHGKSVPPEVNDMETFVLEASKA